MATRHLKVDPIYLTCAACREGLELRDLLRLGDGHTDLCSARPTLLRIDSTSDGRWLPLLQSPQNLTPPDRDRIREEINEMIESFRAAGK